jgi:hypothetical protein
MEDTGEREASRQNGVWLRAWAMIVPATVIALMVLVLGGGTACGREDGEGPVPATTPASKDAPTDPDAGSTKTVWRFVPTLEQHLPAGAVGEPVLELSQPRQYQVVVLAAVLRAGAEHVELERWTFVQNPDGQTLRLVEGGEPLLRLRPGTRSPKLVDLRRELAAPRGVVTRPLGLADDPRGLLGALATAFATLRDAKAEPRARVSAAATVVRGLDDTLVFERDAIWEVAEVLAEVLASGPTEVEVEMLAERRARARLPDPALGSGGMATLELQRKSDGWAIAALERPKPPAPSSEGETTGSTG